MAKSKKRNDVIFSLIDTSTVLRLQREGAIVLPKKKINIPKDKRWNIKLMNSKLLRGILNGDSVDKIADSIFPEIMSKTDFTGMTTKEIYGKGGVINQNRVSAVRAARTMVTQAENGGRLDSYKNLAEQGVVQKKIWEATPDDRVRDSHLDIDGEEQDIDVPFSNGCMFPGDGNGPADEVWNCRCSMKDHIIGFKKPDGSISYVDYKPNSTMHDDQIEAEKKRRESRGGSNKR